MSVCFSSGINLFKYLYTRICQVELYFFYLVFFFLSYTFVESIKCYLNAIKPNKYYYS